MQYVHVILSRGDGTTVLWQGEVDYVPRMGDLICVNSENYTVGNSRTIMYDNERPYTQVFVHFKG